jgi:hypothetical protein
MAGYVGSPKLGGNIYRENPISYLYIWGGQKTYGSLENYELYISTNKLIANFFPSKRYDSKLMGVS